MDHNALGPHIRSIAVVLPDLGDGKVGGLGLGGVVKADVAVVLRGQDGAADEVAALGQLHHIHPQQEHPGIQSIRPGLLHLVIVGALTLVLDLAVADPALGVVGHGFGVGVGQRGPLGVRHLRQRKAVPARLGAGLVIHELPGHRRKYRFGGLNGAVLAVYRDLADIRGFRLIGDHTINRQLRLVHQAVHRRQALCPEGQRHAGMLAGVRQADDQPGADLLGGNGNQVPRCIFYGHTAYIQPQHRVEIVSDDRLLHLVQLALGELFRQVHVEGPPEHGPPVLRGGNIGALLFKGLLHLHPAGVATARRGAVGAGGVQGIADGEGTVGAEGFPVQRGGILHGNGGIGGKLGKGQPEALKAQLFQGQGTAVQSGNRRPLRQGIRGVGHGFFLSGFDRDLHALQHHGGDQPAVQAAVRGGQLVRQGEILPPAGPGGGGGGPAGQIAKGLIALLAGADGQVRLEAAAGGSADGQVAVAQGRGVLQGVSILGLAAVFQEHALVQGAGIGDGVALLGGQLAALHRDGQMTALHGDGQVLLGPAAPVAAQIIDALVVAPDLHAGGVDVSGGFRGGLDPLLGALGQGHVDGVLQGHPGLALAAGVGRKGPVGGAHGGFDIGDGLAQGGVLNGNDVAPLVLLFTGIVADLVGQLALAAVVAEDLLGLGVDRVPIHCHIIGGRQIHLAVQALGLHPEAQVAVVQFPVLLAQGRRHAGHRQTDAAVVSGAGPGQFSAVGSDAQGQVFKALRRGSAAGDLRAAGDGEAAQVPKQITCGKVGTGSGGHGFGVVKLDIAVGHVALHQLLHHHLDADLLRLRQVLQVHLFVGVRVGEGHGGDLIAEVVIQGNGKLALAHGAGVGVVHPVKGVGTAAAHQGLIQLGLCQIHAAHAAAAVHGELQVLTVGGRFRRLSGDAGQRGVGPGCLGVVEDLHSLAQIVAALAERGLLPFQGLVHVQLHLIADAELSASVDLAAVRPLQHHLEKGAGLFGGIALRRVGQKDRILPRIREGAVPVNRLRESAVLPDPDGHIILQVQIPHQGLDILAAFKSAVLYGGNGIPGVPPHIHKAGDEILHLHIAGGRQAVDYAEGIAAGVSVLPRTLGDDMGRLFDGQQRGHPLGYRGAGRGLPRPVPHAAAGGIAQGQVVEGGEGRVLRLALVHGVQQFPVVHLRDIGHRGDPVIIVGAGVVQTLELHHQGLAEAAVVDLGPHAQGGHGPAQGAADAVRHIARVVNVNRQGVRLCVGAIAAENGPVDARLCGVPEGIVAFLVLAGVLPLAAHIPLPGGVAIVAAVLGAVGNGDRPKAAAVAQFADAEAAAFAAVAEHPGDVGIGPWLDG